MVISQSGGNSMEIVNGLAQRGARFSKVVSFGNGEDVAAPELFDYAASDDESPYVVAYLEGTAHGRALFEALARCARVKPTIVLKGGMTAAGARAASSHTGSLAGSREVFEALCRQTGALLAETMEELHDLLIAVTTNTRLVRGNRALMIGGGGGFSVLAADAIARAGMDLPHLAQETTAQLRELMPVAGNSVHNPIDASHFNSGEDRAEAYQRLLEIGAHAPGVDVLFVMTGGALDFSPPSAEEQLDPDHARQHQERRQQADQRSIEELIKLQEASRHPVVGVRRARASSPAPTDEVLGSAYEHGLGVFPSVPRAARTIARLIEWRAAREGLPELF
jgi:acyl-CoA synthetase (NDP forming)